MKISSDTISIPLTDPPLPPRKPTDHKGLFGHALIIGGDLGMGGAVCLAAEAALRSGAGLVTAVTRPEHVSALLTRCPEVMCRGIPDNADCDSLLSPLLKKATVCVIGPGMTDSPWSNALFSWILGQSSILESTPGQSPKPSPQPLPLVIDAGALDWLVKNKSSAPLNSHTQNTPKNWVLTPHPGEAANLLGITSSEIQKNRLASVKALQQKWGGVIILKGAGTLICDGQETPNTSESPIQICEYQNAAMATAGMGDVLSGIIGALIAQGCSPSHAASQGVWLHAQAAELALKDINDKLNNNHLKRQNLLASELFGYLGVFTV